MRKPEINKEKCFAFIIVLTFALILMLSSVPSAYAYDLNDLPGNVATQLGIDEFTAGIIVSFIFLLFPTVMLAFAMKKSASAAILYSILITDFTLMGALVGLGWLPYWIFLILCLIIALLFAGQIRELITGK